MEEANISILVTLSEYKDILARRMTQIVNMDDLVSVQAKCADLATTLTAVSAVKVDPVPEPVSVSPAQ